MSLRLCSLRNISVALCSVVAFACGGDDDDGATCVADLPATCTPSINPTFAEIHQKVLVQSCGVSGAGSSCHGAGRQGGLGFSTIDGAYDDLLRSVVTPGDAACSKLVERLETSDVGKRMPLAAGQLPEGLRCAVRMWIDAGAKRQ